MLAARNFLPIAMPLMVYTIESQGQHMLGIVRTPPCARALHALLNNIAVGAFNFSRSNGQVTLDGVFVIELIPSVVEVSVALSDGGIAVHLPPF